MNEDAIAQLNENFLTLCKSMAIQNELISELAKRTSAIEQKGVREGNIVIPSRNQVWLTAVAACLQDKATTRSEAITVANQILEAYDNKFPKSD